jgi:uncharacterized NAD(P)/FAD-binding protein YdhS
MRTVAVIGGGFSGSLAAVNLVRLAKTPLQIFLINHGYPLGRGIAYSTTRGEHLLNVAARNMSAFPEQPNHFVEWLRTRFEYAEVPEADLREQFMPRRVYGDYVRGLLFSYGRGDGVSSSRLDCVDGEVLDVVLGSGRAAIVVAGHKTIEADKVLLAAGNQAPADVAAQPFDQPRYLVNPWENLERRLTDRRDNVLLLGAGLTMIDVFLTLQARDWQGTITAVSRTGLLPLSHFKGIAYPDFTAEDVATLGLDALAALVEKHCAQLRARGENPAIVVDKLRPFTQRIWQGLSVAEKEQFLKNYRTRWNVTRHRIAQSIHEKLTAAIAAGKLRVVKGKLRELAGSDRHIQMTVQTGPAGQQEVLQGDWLINCTGPQESFRHSNSILFQNLFGRGLVQADDLDMGIKVAPDFNVIDGGGYPTDFLYAMGPLLKGTLWETTAVPELRMQAQRVAETILSRLEGGPSPEWAEMYVELREYSI